ncbi:MAG TPA: sodium:proton exchanger, partial [Burkholderiaceae bacterium]|nr:sodium:proton exchanger [Burkholderiaceae bacterium]
LNTVLAAGGIAIVLLAVRMLGKVVAVGLLAHPSGLSWRQAGSVALGLLPLSATAWLMGLEFDAAHPGPGTEMMPLLLASIALLELVAPLALLYGLRWTGEVDAAHE